MNTFARFSILSLFFIACSSIAFAQTFTFNAWPAGNTSYTTTAGTNTMTAVYSESGNFRANTLANTTCFSVTTTTPAIPFYYNEATMYIADYSSGSCYCSASAAQSGLTLAANWPDNNATRYEQLVLTFTNPVCSPVTFTIWEINQAIWSGDGSHYFTDVVDISATDAALAPIAPGNITIGSCGTNSVTTAGNIKTITAVGDLCTCGSTTVSIGGSMIKTITITYKNGGATYSPDPWSQFINITNITAAAPPTCTITGLPLTCGSSTTTLTASTSAGSPTYQWTGPGTIVSPTSASTSVTGAGTYTVTINPGGCSATATFAVIPSGVPPNVSATANQTITCTTTTISASSSTLGVTYQWTGPGIVSGATTANPVVNAAGTYTVTVTDPSNGCTATTTVVVSLNNTPPNVTPGSPLNLTCTITSGTISASSSTGGVTYSWAGPGIVSGGTTSSPTVNAVGTYTVTVTNPANGCTSTATVAVNNTGVIPNVSAGPPLVLTCTTLSGTISASSSTGGVTYSWAGPGITSGGNTSSPTVNAVGTYTVTVTDGSNGCTNTTTVVVSLNNTPPNASAGAPLVLTCTTLSGTISASSSTGGVTYAWAGPGITSGGNTSSPTVNAVGTYTVTVTNPANGCTSTATVVVSLNNTIPNITAGAPLTLNCTNASGNISASSSTGGVTYSWTGPGITSGGNTASPTVNAAGTYTVTVTDPANGCTNSTTVVVSLNNTPPTVTAGAPLTINCTITSGTISASSSTGGVTYSWSGPGIISGGNTSTPTVNAAGIYTVTVTDPSNGCTVTATVSVTNSGSLPNVTAGSPLVLTCAVTSGTISASSSTSGVTYNWSGPGIVTGGNTSSPTVNVAGTYTVTVTDPSNGCTSTATVSVTNSGNVPNVTAGSPLVLNCNITSGTISASSTTSGVTYSWAGPGITSGANTSSPTVNAAGTYSVTVTDPSNGCTITTTVLVTVNTTPPNVTPGSAVTLNCVSMSGTISASSTTPGATFSWAGPGITSGGNTTSPTINAAGTYTVTVTDPATGCTNTATVLATISGGPTANAGTDVTISSGSSTTLTATGGGTYVWSTGETTSCINVQPTVTTNYCVVVTDGNGCVDSACVTVTVEAPCPSNDEFQVPNAFSPNSDGHNDQVCLLGWSNCVTEFNIRIYDRWGEKVFESNDAGFCWDGNYKGKALDPAVFVYYITAKASNSKDVIRTGNISLIR